MKIIKRHFPDVKALIRNVIIAAFVVIYIAFLFFFNQIDKTKIVDYSGRTFVKAKVVNILRDNLAPNGQRNGSQLVQVLVLSGEDKGRTYEASSSTSDHIGVICKVGMEVTIEISKSKSGDVVTVFGPNRDIVLYGFVGFFILVLCLVGGKKGIRSTVALGFTFSTIIFLYLPLIYRGFSPFLGAILVAVLTTIVSLCIIGGYTVKTISGIIGTIFGILVSGLFACFFGKIANVSGYSVSDYETLLYIGQSTKIGIGELLFAGVLFSSLGAVMDVGYSIASAIEEIKLQNPDVSGKQLFISGIRIGRDMIGTMCNTLILAFAGSMLTMLVSIYSYNQPYAETINSSEIAIDAMQSLSGSMGIILTVPMVALVSSNLIPLFRKKKNFS